METGQRIRPEELQAMKQRGEKIAALTAYDFFTARMLDEAGIPLLLVGDSLGMVVLGYENTLPVTMEDMLHHTRAVARARPRGLIIGDLPYRTYETPADAAANARRFIEAGADGVKIEGGANLVPQIRAVRDAGIPVLGHIGLLPQSVEKQGGFKVQGRTAESAVQLRRDATALATAGVFAIVVECVVAALATAITGQVAVPTLGIGAGPGCDGQILVTHDLLGLFGRSTKHAKRYADLGAAMRQAFAAYRREVEAGEFPGPEHTFL